MCGVTRYVTIAEPFVVVGAFQWSVALSLPGVTVTDNGGVGVPIVIGVACQGIPSPRAFVAYIVNVYAFPFVRFFTVPVLAPVEPLPELVHGRTVVPRRGTTL